MDCISLIKKDINRKTVESIIERFNLENRVKIPFYHESVFYSQYDHYILFKVYRVNPYEDTTKNELKTICLYDIDLNILYFDTEEMYGCCEKFIMFKLKELGFDNTSTVTIPM